MSSVSRATTRRLPLVERRQAARVASRRRAVARITRPLSDADRQFDPLDRDPRGVGARLRRLGVSLFAGLALHGAILVGGLWLARSTTTTTVEPPPVKIEVRERPPEPKVELPPPPAPVEAPKVEPPPPEPAKAPLAKAEPLPKAPPPVEPPPAEPPPKAPPRVIGLSLDSTAAGGDGPAFAVGNSRAGSTADRAADAKNVDPNGTGPTVAQPTPPVGPNAAATRIPVAGSKVVPPKRKNADGIKAPYPETLKTQGIEADVLLIVSISAEGKVTSVRVAKSSTYPEFDEAAKTAVQDELYEPATRDGVAMPYTLSFTYRFRLEDS